MKAACDLRETSEGYSESGELIETLYAFYGLCGGGNVDQLLRRRSELEAEFKQFQSIRLERN